MTLTAELHQTIAREVGKVIIGQQDAVRLILIALVCEGHVLLEDVPHVVGLVDTEPQIEESRGLVDPTLRASRPVPSGTEMD